MIKVFRVLPVILILVAAGPGAVAEPPEGDGWVSLFNGKDLSGWKIPEAGPEIWSVVDGTIDCDPRIGREGDLALWSENEFGDFEIQLDWRLKRTEGLYPMSTILPDGSNKVDADGKPEVAPPQPTKGR